ncbi:MFS transporter [Micromonospora sp. B11E3]|uniref:MFS transporter n=1 Tax=Micromonospora sp. B11E3 TaxID=3153562 RepID=UPI00325EA90A
MTTNEIYDDLTPRNRSIATFALLACAFLAMLDGTVIVTALPKIVEQVEGDSSWFIWLITGYLLTSSVSVPIYGRFSDLYGRRSLLLIGLFIFVAGSLACALADSMVFLIAARTVQGLGAGALLTLSMAAIRDLYPPGRSTGMVRMQTVLAIMMIVGMVGGPLLGGLLTDHASWRWTFLINLPIGGTALVLLSAILPSGRTARVTTGKLDALGITVLTVSLSLLTIGLSIQSDRTGSQQFGWTHPAVALPLLVGLVLLAALVPVERRAQTPVLPLQLLRRRSYTALLTGGFFFQAASLPISFMVPLYLHDVRHYSASSSGALLLPLLIGMAVSSRLTATVILKTGRTRPVLLVGACLLTAGAVGFLLLDDNTSPVLIGVWLTLAGLGTGPAMGGITIAAQNSVPPTDIGTATAGSTLTKQIGGVFSLAIAQTLLNQQDVATGFTSAGVGGAIGWLGGTAGLLALVSMLVMRDVLVFVPGKSSPKAMALAESRAQD